MTGSVHPTALVDPSARLGEGAEIGPYAMVGPGVTVGAGARVRARATIERNARLGARVTVGEGSIVGGDPQDLKYAGEESWVEIGDDTVLREFVTVNRGTAATGRTQVGAGCVLMSYVHVAHDCHLGDGVMIANATQLAGHVTIHDRASVSGLVAIHQFVTIGTLAFIGGASRVNQDIPPFVKAVGNPVALYGLNSVGLRRAQFPPETVTALKRAYRLFFNSELTLSQAQDRVRRELAWAPEVELLADFVARSQRGVPA